MTFTLQGVPAIAVSLDNYKALTPEGFMAGAAYVVAFIKASRPPSIFPDQITWSDTIKCYSSHCFAVQLHDCTTVLWTFCITITEKLSPAKDCPASSLQSSV